MPSNAFSGVGTLFKRGVQTVAEINSISGPNMSRGTIDVTSLDSTGGYREFIAGFRDAGEVTLNCNFSLAEWSEWLEDFQSDDLVTYQITLANPQATTIDFSALCTSLGMAIPMDDKVTCDVTLKISGALTVGS